MSFTAVALSLSLTYVPLLSPEAVELNMKAMSFYDAGQFSPAVDGFHAAYQSMPDARRDKAGRQMLLGSMAMTLRQLHEQTHPALRVNHPALRVNHTALRVNHTALRVNHTARGNHTASHNAREHSAETAAGRARARGASASACRRRSSAQPADRRGGAVAAWDRRAGRARHRRVRPPPRPERGPGVARRTRHAPGDASRPHADARAGRGDAA